MRRAWFVLLATLCLVSPSVAENPADLTFTLSPANGRTTFRMGEAIEVEFRISSTAPGKYVLEDSYSARFNADPADGAVSPRGGLYPAGQLEGSGARSGPPPRMIALNANSTVQTRQLNMFFSFRKSGHYRIIAETDTVGLADGRTRGGVRNPITLRSNSIDIEIIKPEPGWEETQLRANLALLAQWTPVSPSGLGQRGNNPQGELAAINGVRALGLLETREAALALVDFYGRELPISVTQYIDQGLRRSPYPKEIVAAMEKQLDMPDVPITRQWFGIFSDLTAIVASNPPDFAKAYAGSRDRLNRAIPKKRGNSADISIRTLNELR